MTYYSTMNISTNEIAGAIAMEALHNLRVNNFMFPGFPSIEVSDLSEGKFIVTISSGSKNEHNISFPLSKKEGVTVAKNFKEEKRTGNDMFETVQNSLAQLERIVLDNR